MEISYKITHPRKSGYLSAFHANGGWQIGDVFPFSKYLWLSFATEEKAQEYIARIIRDCNQQEKRWGDWTKKALHFASKLSYTKHFSQ